MYFNTSPYTEIISGISTIFSFSDGVVKLTGSRGTGKTALVRELADELRGEGMEVIVFDTLPKTAEELQDYLVRKLDLPTDVTFRKALLRHLHIRPRDRQRLILVIDDAEHISIETLLAVSSLRRLENDNQAFVNVLLCGEAGLDRLLASPELAEFSSDISMQYQLKPMDTDQLGKFCASYLNYIGKSHYQLSNEHLDMLHRDSQGLPGHLIEHLGEHLTDPSFLLSLGKPESINFRKKSLLDAEPAPGGLESIRALLADGYKDWLKLLTGAAVTLTIASVLYGTSQYWSRFLIGSTPDSAAPSAVVPTPAQPRPLGEDPPAQPVETPAPAGQPADETPDETRPAVQPPAAQAPAVTTAETPVTQPPQPVPQQPQPTPTVVDAPTPAPPPIPAASNTALRTSVDLWAAAWQRQDVDAYLAAYHSEFTPQYHNSLSSWRNDRIRNLTRPASISIDISNFELIGTDGENSTVSFSQEYRSPTYADRTQKELVLGRDADGQLRILREVNQEVVRIPAGRERNGATAQTTQAATQTRALASDTESAGTDDGSVSQFITSWLDAWQGKDVEAYLSHYHIGYKPDSAASAEEWRNDRTLKINRPSFIQLQLQEMQIVERRGDETLVRLTLEYRSNFYADRTTKLLRVQRTADGELRIVMERNTLVETLPMARLSRPAPQVVRAFGRAIVEQTF